ncbi:MAG: large conductance mechanosensitive channel protein MscL [Bacillota bacterium]
MIDINFLKNFKEFAVRGNVVDMGIGVVVGTAFSKIVDSLVSDIIMPPIGLMLGKVNFSNLHINLSGGHYHTLDEAKEAGAVTINYGVFLDSILHFALITLATYFTIVQINRLRRAPAESLTTKECPYCFVNIPSRALRCPQCTTSLDGEDKLAQKKASHQSKPENGNQEKRSIIGVANSHQVKVNIK